MSTKTKNKQEIVVQTYRNRWFIPLVIALTVVPLICLAHMYEIGLNKYEWFGANVTQIDVFLYFKSRAIMLLGLIVLCMICYMGYKDKGKNLFDKQTSFPVIGGAIFALFCLISAIMSEHPQDAFLGGYGQFEGCLVLISYVVCFIMATCYIKNEGHIRFIVDALMISALIIGAIGALQRFGLDIFDTPFMTGIMNIGMSDKSTKYNMFQGISYSTLFNPNYVGSYVVLVMPFSVYMTVRGIGMKRRVISGITSVFLIVSLIGAGSDAGIVGMAFAILVAVILIMPFMNRILKICVIGAGILAMAVGAYILIGHDIIGNLFTKDEPQIIENMKTSGTNVMFKTYDGAEVKVTLDEDAMQTYSWAQDCVIENVISIKDAQTKEDIPYHKNDNGHLVLDKEGLPPMEMFFEIGTMTAEESDDGEETNYSIFSINDTKYTWSFSTDEGKIKYISYLNKLSNMRYIDRVGFEGMYHFASGRGYLWAATLPLLSDYIITGAGADNFVYAFPNDDYVGYVENGYTSSINTKPHNLFLQIWVQDGLIALIAFIFLYLLLMFRVVRLLFGKNRVVRKGIISIGAGASDGDIAKHEDASDVSTAPTDGGQLALGIAIATAIGTSGYMVAGVANDSIVCVAPVYWVLLGVGYAAVGICRRDPADTEAPENSPKEDNKLKKDRKQ